MAKKFPDMVDFQVRANLKSGAFNDLSLQVPSLSNLSNCYKNLQKIFRAIANS